MSKLILVTGAGGYLAMHVVKKFLDNGFKVRGTVRNFNDTKKVEALRLLSNQLELVEADLLVKDNWPAVLKDVNIVCHVASPFPSAPVQDENVLIRPALEGTMNVLTAAFETKTVERVVLTSSNIAITGYNKEDRIYNELDWPDPDKQYAYGKSKILAERAAWNFVNEKKNSSEKCFDLTVINPSFILGPTLHGLDTILGTSESRFLSILNGSSEKIPHFNFGLCDVRDVAEAHFKAAFLTEAIGQRHAILSRPNSVSMKDIADILYAEFGTKGYKIPREEENADVPLSKASVDNSRMINILGITPRSIQETIIDMANSLIHSGLVKKPE